MSRQKLIPFFLLVFPLLFFMPGIAKLPVIDRDEAHFAQASRQMVQTGNYFQVRFQDKTRFQKPPGINWLQAASVGLFSNGEASSIWPYRIPSLLGALLSVLLIYAFSCNLIGARGALLAASFLASSLLLVVEAHMAVIDTSLLSAVLLMQMALWNIYHKSLSKESVSWIWPLLFWLAMAYGFVLKGVTPLVGFLTIAVLCLFDRQIAWLRGLHIIKGLILFALLSVAWLLLLNAQEHSNYLMQMLHKDLLPKLQGGHESHGKPPLFHFFILPLTFWPASLFLWQGGLYAFYNRQQPLVKFLLAWIIPTWIFFELMPTKLPQYILPTFPAIALLCALSIENAGKIKPFGRFLHCLQCLWVVLSIGIAIALIILAYLVMQQWSFLSLILFFSLAIFSVIACYYSWHGRYYYASMAVLIIALFAYPLIFNGILPQLKPVWLSDNIVQLIDKKKISKDKPLLVVGFEEPSLVFNLNTHLVKFVDDLTAEKLLQKDKSRLALIESTHFKPVTDEQMAYNVVANTQGYNYSKGRWVELFLISRG